METRVPICGEYPFLGPMILMSASSDIAVCGTSANPDAAIGTAAATIRKFRRVGAHSVGNMGPPSGQSGLEPNGSYHASTSSFVTERRRKKRRKGGARRNGEGERVGKRIS